MKFSIVTFLFGSLQQASRVNSENLRRDLTSKKKIGRSNVFASSTTEGGSCTGLIQATDYENSPDILSPACERDDGTIVPIAGRESTFWEQKMESGEFTSGRTQVSGCDFVQSFPGGPDECFIPAGRSLFLSNVVTTDNQEEDEGRNLATVTGDKTILVVRVIAEDGYTTADENALASDVFEDSVNVATQYKACSYGKLNFKKATSRTLIGTNDGGGVETGINNGVTTVRVFVSTGQGDGIMRNAITAALNENFGVSPSNLADHVMYCLPAGTMSGIAYAYINSWNSVYSNQWCNYVSAQMHEIGHNLNAAHAGEVGTYKDQTGMMGYSYSQDDGPIMCFNAAKSWQFGWYSDKASTLDKTNKRSYVGVLGGIADYADSNIETVLVKLNTSGSSTDYFVNFNRRFGINSGTVEGGDQVTVVMQGSEGTAYAESELVAKLNALDTYTISNFDGSGETATVTVNSIGGATADVSICIGPCPSPTPIPTPVPTPNPTSSDPPTQSPNNILTLPPLACEDSTTWVWGNNKHCTWIGNTNLCDKVGTEENGDTVIASIACPVKCNTCPT